MRRLVALVFVTCTLSCSTPQNITEQAQLPALTPPPMHAPICARPAERAAIDVSALVSELQLITMTCGTRDKYNALIPRLRPALATKEKISAPSSLAPMASGAERSTTNTLLSLRTCSRSVC